MFGAILQERYNGLLSQVEIIKDIIIKVVRELDFSSFYIVEGLYLLLIDICFD